MVQFDKPDRTKWGESDARQSIEWDMAYFRELYNGTAIFKEHALPANKVKPLHSFWMQCRGDALDVGCGNGLTLLSLLKGGMITSGVGIDVSDVAINSARQTAENIGIEATFTRTPLEEFATDKKFDTIVCTDVLEHFFNVEWAVGKMHRLLKSDGIFLGGTPYKRHRDDGVEHLHYFEKDDLQGLFYRLYRKVCITCDDCINFLFACAEPISHPDWLDIQYRSVPLVSEQHARDMKLTPKQRTLVTRHLAQGGYIQNGLERAQIILQ